VQRTGTDTDVADEGLAANRNPRGPKNSEGEGGHPNPSAEIKQTIIVRKEKEGNFPSAQPIAGECGTNDSYMPTGTVMPSLMPIFRHKPRFAIQFQ
jgi:hypothetical protein